MLLAGILCVWAFTTAPTIAALQVQSNNDSPLLSRLDRLESLVADHQAQFQHERAQWEMEKQSLQYARTQWEKENQILRERLDLLQGDVHALQREKQETKREIEALQNTQTLTQPLVAENQGLKEELGDLQRQLTSMEKKHHSQLSRLQHQLTSTEKKHHSQLSRLHHQLADMNRKQQSLKDPVTKGQQNAGPGRAEDGDLQEDDEQILGERSGPAVQKSEHQGDFQEVKDPNLHGLRDRSPIQNVSVPDSFRQHQHEQHERAVRSDDGGPLEAVVDRLAQRTTQLEADFQVLRTSDTQQGHDIQAAGGSTFIHWGSSTCSGSSELVYSGVVGGSSYGDTGAAANFLCLTLSPRLQNNHYTRFTHLYGAEYETDDSHNNMDAVCAVCRPSQPTTVMIPATDVCSSGWALQYSGFLMAGYHGDTGATQFICVDSKLENVIGSKANNVAHSLFFTVTQCGSLPCTPYADNRLVTCAVCSK